MSFADMLEQQQTPSVFAAPWEKQPFRYAAQHANDVSSVEYGQPKQEAQVPETPYWLGGPLNEELDMLSSRQQQPLSSAHSQQDISLGREHRIDASHPTWMNHPMGSVLPSRRHSLAYESLGQPSPVKQLPVSNQKRASLSGAFSNTLGQTSWTSTTDSFGSTIWSPSGKPSNGHSTSFSSQTSLLWDPAAPASSNASAGLSPVNYSPSPTATTSSQSLFSSRLPQSYHEEDDEPLGPLRSMRRLSLAPLPTTNASHAKDHFGSHDMLSSVPEEPSFIPYRRHSLAGPLLGVASSRHSTHELHRQPSPNLSLDLLPSNPLLQDLLSVEPIKLLRDKVSWCMVEFKASRSEVYYSTIPIQKDDWVIVEADRGRDLGKVVATDIPPEQAAILLQSNQGLREDVSPSSSGPASPFFKRINRLATTTEITLLVTKRQDEQKALLICQTKSKQKKLNMDIVDAEYQWDRRKLTFYFVAERRVDFRELVRELFKIYKTRIWMCSVNTVAKNPLL